MTPIGHFATSMLTGTVAWKLTGSPVAGGITAILTHIPADLLFNEFYEWGSNRAGALAKRLHLFLMLIPAVLLFYSCITELNAYHQMWFGLLGVALDIDEVIAAVFGLPVFPCHPGSVYYIPARFWNNWEPKMLSLPMTAIWENIMAIVAVILVILLT